MAPAVSIMNLLEIPNEVRRRKLSAHSFSQQTHTNHFPTMLSPSNRLSFPNSYNQGVQHEQTSNTAPKPSSPAGSQHLHAAKSRRRSFRIHQNEISLRPAGDQRTIYTTQAFSHHQAVQHRLHCPCGCCHGHDSIILASSRFESDEVSA